MSNRQLPWDSVPGPKYCPREMKPQKKWVTVGGWFMSAFLIAGGVMTRYRIAAIFGVLYVWALLTVRTIMVTERGVETFHQMRITTNYSLLSWQDIQYVSREDRNHPELVALYFSNGDKAKRLFFTKPDAEKVMAMAREQNSNIVVGDIESKQTKGSYKKKY